MAKRTTKNFYHLRFSNDIPNKKTLQKKKQPCLAQHIKTELRKYNESRTIYHSSTRTTK